MKIDIEKLDQLVKDSDKIFIKSESEKVLVKLLEIQQQVEDAIEQAKGKLEKAALKLDKNFKSIQADKIKVYYRQYGAKYWIDPTRVKDIPKELYNKKVSYLANTFEIDKVANESGKIPLGIKEADRSKTLSISLKNE